MRFRKEYNSLAFLGQLQDSSISCTFWILTSGLCFSLIYSGFLLVVPADSF